MPVLPLAKLLNRIGDKLVKPVYLEIAHFLLPNWQATLKVDYSISPFFILAES